MNPAFEECYRVTEWASPNEKLERYTYGEYLEREVERLRKKGVKAEIRKKQGFLSPVIALFRIPTNNN